MSGGTIAAISAYRPRVTVTGTLTKTAAPSGGIVTSDTVTVSVPIVLSGLVQFASFTISGTVTTQYSKNGGAFTTVIEGDSVTFANGDTLAVRGSSMTAGESWTFSLADSTSQVVGTYTITAS